MSCQNLQNIPHQVFRGSLSLIVRVHCVPVELQCLQAGKTLNSHIVRRPSQFEFPHIRQSSKQFTPAIEGLKLAI